MPVADPASPPRRLARHARRRQILAAAMPLLARVGPSELQLDAVAARVGVTRNLLYHYFPGGRADLVAALVREAERQLLGDSDGPPAPQGTRRPHSSEHLHGPLAPHGTVRPHSSEHLQPPLSSEHLQRALSRILDHALAPTHAWLVHRSARSSGQPEVSEMIEASTQRVAGVLASLDGSVPGYIPLEQVALPAFVTFAEEVLDRARSAGTSRTQLRHLLGQTLTAILVAEQEK